MLFLSTFLSLVSSSIILSVVDLSEEVAEDVLRKAVEDKDYKVISIA